jgi:membrane protein YdbS with pleckstrin-like domain
MSDGGEEPAPRPRTAGTDAGPGPASRSTSRADRERNSGQESAEFDARVARARTALRESTRSVDPGTLREYTTERRDLHPSVRFLWGLRTTVGVAVLTAILTGVIGAAGLPVQFGLLVLVVLFGLGSGLVLLRYRRWVYQVRTDSLYLERGVFVHRRTHAPYVRIQHVDTSRGPLERWLGLSTLVVYTAGSRGADISIPGLEPAEARDLQQRVKQLAIDAEGDDAL